MPGQPSSLLVCSSVLTCLRPGGRPLRPSSGRPDAVLPAARNGRWRTNGDTEPAFGERPQNTLEPGASGRATGSPLAPKLRRHGLPSGSGSTAETPVLSPPVPDLRRNTGAPLAAGSGAPGDARACDDHVRGFIPRRGAARAEHRHRPELTKYHARGPVNVAPFPATGWRSEGRGLGASRLPVTRHLDRLRPQLTEPTDEGTTGLRVCVCVCDQRACGGLGRARGAPGSPQARPMQRAPSSCSRETPGAAWRPWERVTLWGRAAGNGSRGTHPPAPCGHEGQRLAATGSLPASK